MLVADALKLIAVIVPLGLDTFGVAVALAFAGDVGFSFAKNLRLEKKNEAALARLDPRSFKPARNASAEEVAAARETVQRLSTPWEKLLGALESAANDQVALLSIEPDPKAGTVKISGDSKDYLAVLTYVLNLSRAEALSGVQLARHAISQEKGDGKQNHGQDAGGEDRAHQAEMQWSKSREPTGHKRVVPEGIERHPLRHLPGLPAGRRPYAQSQTRRCGRDRRPPGRAA